MVLRIERDERPGSVVFLLSGRIELQHVAELQAQFAAQCRRISIDLKEVRLVDRAVIDTLAGWQEDGIKLENCPAYVREWIAKSRSRKQPRREF